MATFPPPTSTSGGPGSEDGSGSKGKGPMPADEVVRMERGKHEIRTREVTQKDRVLAASCGAIVTSLTMTPFDVVKTRLQTQPASSQPMLFSPSASTAATSSSTCCQKTYFNTNAASENLLCRFDPRQTTSFLPATGSHRPFSRVAIASLLPSSGGSVEALVHPHGSAAAACIFPDSRVAAQTLSEGPRDALVNRPARGLFDAMVLIVRREGLSALWRGVSPALAMSVPSQAVYMVGYDTLRRSLYIHAPSTFRTPSSSSSRPSPTGEGLEPRYRNLIAPLSAGAVSRTLVAVAFSPLELFRTRLQASSDLSSTSAVVRATWSSVRSEGLVTLWRGLPATLWRDVPFSAVYWAGYETTRRFLTGGKGMGERDVGRRLATSSTADDEVEVARAKVRTMAKSFVAGSVSGCAAAVVTNPFDVVKTRRQAGTIDGGAAAEGTLATLARIAREEGRPALMKGLTPRLAKIVPACGIMIASYEGLAQVLAEWC